MKPDLSALPETITVPRTDPIYNCHAYLTKVPIGAIRPFINAFTQPDEVVVDFFAGSGMTGLAAVMENRRARLSDISALGQHIATGYLTSVRADTLTNAAEGVISTARKAIGSFYATKRCSDGQQVNVVRTVWSFTYICPECSTKMVYFEHLNGSGRPPATCPSCDTVFVRRTWGRANDVPVEVVVIGEAGKQVTQPVSDSDRRKIRKAAKDPRLEDVPNEEIAEYREMYSRSGLGKAGMTQTAKFFSSRNGIALLELWRAINQTPDDSIKQKLRFAFTAILARASKRYQWGPKRPLNAQNQTYYIAPVYYEWNVFELFARKVRATIRASDMLFGDAPLFNKSPASDVKYELASADNLAHLKNNSVDYVFTDPPFGSNIFYSDMNLFHEAWLGKLTNHESEAVVYTTGKRKADSEKRYEKLLRDAFREGLRILRPGKHMSVVFGNSSGRIWGLVQRALRETGFNPVPVHVGVLDKGQRSVKGLNSGSESVVTVDLIVTVQKPLKPTTHLAHKPLTIEVDRQALISDAIEDIQLSGMHNPSHVYARILRNAIRLRVILDDLHLSDVLVALRQAGYQIDPKTGLLTRSLDECKLAA